MTPAILKPQLSEASITREERSNLILAFARVLYINGESTQQTLRAANRLGDFLGMRASILPRWGELELKAEDNNGTFISATEADPSGVDMNRVTSTLRTIEELGEGRLVAGSASQAIN